MGNETSLYYFIMKISAIVLYIYMLGGKTKEKKERRKGEFH